MPDLLREAGGAHGTASRDDGSGGEGDDDDAASKSGGRPSADSSALETPKPHGDDWYDKDDRFVVVASGSDAGRSTATDDKAVKDEL